MCSAQSLGFPFPILLKTQDLLKSHPRMSEVSTTPSFDKVQRDAASKDKLNTPFLLCQNACTWGSLELGHSMEINGADFLRKEV